MKCRIGDFTGTEVVSVSGVGLNGAEQLKRKCNIKMKTAAWILSP